VTYLNDSAASTPESVELALQALSGPIALIFGGGGDKKLSYERLAQAIAERVDHLIVFEGDGIAARVLPLLHTYKGRLATVRAMDEAVVEGQQALAALGGGTLLLSSGCSGWPRFPDMFVRGRLFCEAVHAHLARGAS